MIKNITISKAIFIVFIISIFTRPITFIKEVATANYFGGSAQLEAFLIAFLLPNFLFELLGGIFSSCIIPVYINEKNINSEKGKQLIQSLFFVVLGIGIIFMSLTYFSAPLFIKLLAPGFTDTRYALAIHYLRLFCPYITLIFVIYFLTNILQAEKEFFYSTLTPFFINIGAFVFLIIFHIRFNILSLIIGQYIGSIFAMIILIHKSWNFLYPIKVGNKLWTRPVKEILKLSLPITFGVSINWIVTFTNNFFASMLSYGSVTALYYAYILILSINSFIAYSITKATLPFLSEFYSKGNNAEYQDLIKSSFNKLFFIYLPLGAVFFIFNKEIVSLIYFSKNFNSVIGDKTSIALFFYSLCLIPMGIQALFLPIYYSKRNTKIPMIITSIIAIVNVFLNYTLAHFFDISGIAIATLCSVTLQAGIYIYLTKTKLIDFSEMLKLIFAGVSMIAIIKLGIYFELGHNIQYKSINFSFLSNLIIGGIGYLSLSYIFNINNIKNLIKRLLIN
jgi:putative peptidoglycan lipid II flippase